MKYQCMEHGELSRILARGKTMAGYSSVRPTGKDLEKIVFTIEPSESQKIKPRQISTLENHSERYLEKFKDWRREIAEAIQEIYRHRSGYEKLLCTEHQNSDTICQNIVVDEIFIPKIEDAGELNTDYLRTGGFNGTAEVYWCVEEKEQFEPYLFENIANQAKSHKFDNIEMNISTSDTTGLKSRFEDQQYQTTIEERESPQGFGTIVAQKQL